MDRMGRLAGRLLAQGAVWTKDLDPEGLNMQALKPDTLVLQSGEGNLCPPRGEDSRSFPKCSFVLRS